MFHAPKITDAGQDLYYDSLAGGNITFTKIKLGKGRVNQPISTMTDLVDVVLSIDANVTQPADKSYVDVSGSFDNSDLTEGFSWREIGLFVANPKAPDDRNSDILYCYQNAYDTADFIPTASVQAMEKHVTIPVVVSNAAQVSCLLSKSLVFATQQDIANHNSDTAAHVGIQNKIAELDGELDSHSTDPAAHLAIQNKINAVANNLSNHNSDATAHPAIQNKVNAQGEALSEIENKIGAANGIATLDDDGLLPNDQLPITGIYCTCATAAGVTEKVAQIVKGHFILEAGVAVDVKFTYANTVASPTLNVNNTGAIAIKKYGNTAPTNYPWAAGAVVRFVYDGQYWLVQNGSTATTNTYGVTKLSTSVSSTASDVAATPSAVRQAYNLASNAIPKAQRGVSNGVASLDANGKVPSEQLDIDVSGDISAHNTDTTAHPDLRQYVDDAIQALYSKTSSVIVKFWANQNVTITAKKGETVLTAIANHYDSAFEEYYALFTIDEFGFWTFTDENYGITGAVTIPISASDIGVIEAAARKIHYISWEQISKWARAGKMRLISNIGDTHDFSLNGVNYKARLIGIDHDMVHHNEQYGRNVAGATFLLNSYLDTLYQMHNSTSKYGYVETDLCSTLLSTIWSQIPTSLQSLIVSVRKIAVEYTATGSAGKPFLDSRVYNLCLPSECEILGTTRYAQGGEGSQYEYFRSGNLPIMYDKTGNNPQSYWTRSCATVSSGSSGRFCAINSNGIAEETTATSSRAVCFMFCI